MSKTALDYAMKHHDPVLIAHLGTTGIDRKPFDHYPTRLIIKQLEWNGTEYAETRSFDKYVEIPKSLMKQIEDANAKGNYTPFWEINGFDRAKWEAEAVTKEDWTKALDEFMADVPKDTLCLTNFTENMFYKYIRKDYPEIVSQIKAFDIDVQSMSALGGELYGLSSMKLEALAEKVSPDLLVNGSIPDNNVKMEIFKNFVNAYEKGDLTKQPDKADDKVAAKIEPVKDDKQAAIDDALKNYTPANTVSTTTTSVTSGRRVIRRRTAPSDVSTAPVLNTGLTDAQMHEINSAKGKEEYSKSGIDEKIDKLKQMKVITANTPNLDKLKDIFDNRKGFTVLVVATTGFKCGDRPIQISALTIEINGTALNPVKSISFDVQAEKQYVDAAIADKTFDAFAYTGMDKNRYLKKQGVVSQTEAIDKLAKYFEAYPFSDYPLVTNGVFKKDPKVSYAMGVLGYLGNFPSSFVTADFVDFTQAIKEHISIHGKDSVLLGLNKDIKKFGLADIAQSRSISINNENSIKKVSFTAQLIGDLFDEANGISKEQAQSDRQIQSEVDDIISQFTEETGTIDLSISADEKEILNSDDFSSLLPAEYVE
jgi:hypothetical protein